jgi:hypothetical protein
MDHQLPLQEQQSLAASQFRAAHLETSRLMQEKIQLQSNHFQKKAKKNKKQVKLLNFLKEHSFFSNNK